MGAVQGTSLSNDQIFTSVDCVIQRGILPYATNAVYLLLGASNVKATSGAFLLFAAICCYFFLHLARLVPFGAGTCL